MSSFKDLKDEVGQFTTKTDAAYQVIRQAILSGLLAPGAPIQVGRIAGDLDMSLIPVREALRRLEQDGLVSIRPHAGASVRLLPAEDLEENLLIRSALELLATRLSAAVIQDETLDQLDELVAKMDKCVRQKNTDLYGRLNREFHLMIYKACGKQRLHHFIETLWDQVPRARSVFTLVPGFMQRSQEGHHRLMEALRNRDGSAAEAIVRSQKEAAVKALLATQSASEEAESSASA